MKGTVKGKSSRLLWTIISGHDTGVGLLRNTAMNAEITGSEPLGRSPESRTWSRAKVPWALRWVCSCSSWNKLNLWSAPSRRRRGTLPTWKRQATEDVCLSPALPQAQGFQWLKNNCATPQLKTQDCQGQGLQMIEYAQVRPSCWISFPCFFYRGKIHITQN